MEDLFSPDTCSSEMRIERHSYIAFMDIMLYCTSL